MSAVVFVSKRDGKAASKTNWSCSFKSHRLEPRAADLANLRGPCVSISDLSVGAN